MKPSRRYARHMFPKLNLHEREIFKKNHLSHHDDVSFRFDHFDRRFGINHIGDEKSEFLGVSCYEYLVSGKCQMIDGECYNVGKAT